MRQLKEISELVNKLANTCATDDLGLKIEIRHALIDAYYEGRKDGIDGLEAKLNEKLMSTNVNKE